MSRTEDAILQIRAAVSDLGPKEMARRASQKEPVTDDTVRAILKKPPKSVRALIALEEAAARHEAARPALMDFRHACDKRDDVAAVTAAERVLEAHGIEMNEEHVIDALTAIRHGDTSYPYSDLLK